jgi:hypothetical protein
VFRTSRLLRAAVFIGICLCIPFPAAAQAFTPPERLGSVTASWQFVDNTGHRFSDGFLLARGQSQTTSALFEFDYGVTDRLAVTAGVPFVFAKYTGALPPPSNLPVDSCQCWHSAFQDFAVAVRYRFGNRTWAVTPVARYGRPLHNYAYEGEAVVGRNLNEMQVGVSSAVKLPGVLSAASVTASYVYAFVERPIESISINRTNGFLALGYAATRKLYLYGGGHWQQTHGGLRVGSPTGDPFFPPGELNTPDRFKQRDRLLQANFWQAAGGASYSLGPVDLFASITKYVWGRNAHNGQAYTTGITWYFDLSQ